MSINSRPAERQTAVLPDNFAKSARSADAGSCFAKATAIFRLGRLRAKHFPNGLLADSTMSLMLSLFIGEQQHIILSERTLALANQLSHEDAARIIENLVHAGLVVITGEEPGRRTVGLTPIGSARTRSFVEDHPDL